MEAKAAAQATQAYGEWQKQGITSQQLAPVLQARQAAAQDEAALSHLHAPTNRAIVQGAECALQAHRGLVPAFPCAKQGRAGRSRKRSTIAAWKAATWCGSAWTLRRTD